MHETSAVQALCRQVEEIARQHGASSVRSILLEFGASPHLTPEHVRESFEMFRTLSPLLKETKIDFRESPDVAPDEVVLRDIEMEVPE